MKENQENKTPYESALEQLAEALSDAMARGELPTIRLSDDVPEEKVLWRAVETLFEYGEEPAAVWDWLDDLVERIATQSDHRVRLIYARNDRGLPYGIACRLAGNHDGGAVNAAFEFDASATPITRVRRIAVRRRCRRWR